MHRLDFLAPQNRDHPWSLPACARRCEPRSARTGENSLLRVGSLAWGIAHRVDNGTVTISASRPPNTKGMSGQGSVCNITFKAIAPGDSQLNLVKVGAMNSAHVNLPAVGSQAVVHVK